MKNLTLFLSFYFSLQMLQAQTGWKWAQNATTYGSSTSHGEAAAVAPDRAGGAYVAMQTIFADSLQLGSFVVHNATSGIEPVVVARIDSNGNYMWVKSSSNTIGQVIGMASNASGDVYVFGMYASGTMNFDGNVLPDAGTGRSFLMKITPDGTVAWIRSVGNGMLDYYGAIILDERDNVYIAATFSVASLSFGTDVLNNTAYPGTSADIVIAKFSSQGAYRWAKNFGSSGYDWATSIAKGAPGYLYFGLNVQTDSSATIGATTLHGPRNGIYAKADTNGNIIWAKNLPVGCYLQAMAGDGSGNCYLTGGLFSSATFGPSTVGSVGGIDMFLAKINSAGDFQWGKSAGGAQSEQGFDITVDKCGKIIVAGSLGNFPAISGYSANFSGHTIVVPAGSFDPAFIAEYDTSGNYIWATPLASGGDDLTNTIPVTTDNAGNFFVCSDYTHAQMTFGAHVLDTILSDPGGEYMYVARYKYDLTLCPAELLSVDQEPVSLEQDEIALYPNPATNDFTIVAGSPFLPGSSAELYDFSGRLIKAAPLNGSSGIISVSDMAPGMYLCRIISKAGNVIVKKLVVMK